MKINKNILIKIGIIAILVIGIVYNAFKNKGNTEEIIYSDIFVNETKEEKSSENSIRKIKVYVTGEVNNPRSNRIRGKL